MLSRNEKAIPYITEELLKKNGKIWKANGNSDLNWKSTIEIINLTHSKLKTMKGLEEVENLRQLYLGHNMIGKIEGLKNCKLLEELSLEKN